MQYLLETRIKVWAYPRIEFASCGVAHFVACAGSEPIIDQGAEQFFPSFATLARCADCFNSLSVRNSERLAICS